MELFGSRGKATAFNNRDKNRQIGELTMHRARDENEIVATKDTMFFSVW